MLKFCNYCHHWHDADDFVVKRRGYLRRTGVAMCGNCDRARKNPEASADRLAELTAEMKAKVSSSNKRPV